MLRYLRPSRGERVVWVDAICINQKDSKERGEQVAKMGRIYSQCFQVVIWLGDDLAFKPSKVFATRHSFHELESLEILMPTIKGSTTPLNRLTIQKLLERRYFSRAWVLQELILAARVIIPIGDMVFSVDPLMTEHLNQLTGYTWSWEQTRAPWFQHATRGLLLPKSMFELLRLAWESRSSDVRDKFYAVWGPYTLKPNGIQIQPDYSISLQHLATGFFAHSIINEGASQLLLKASGAYAEVGIPSWMPNCKDPVTWEKLFGNEGEETPSWDQMERIVSISQDSKKDAYFRFTTSPPTEADAPKTIGRRLWYQDATVDADSGAMTLNLTKLFTIGGFKRANGDKGLTWYQFTCMKADLYLGSILLASRSKLDTTVEVEDEVYLFDNNTTEPIYLVLRPTGNQLEFKLIAACPYCVCTFPNNEFFHSSGDHRQGPKVGTIPITDLQQSLYTDLMHLHNCLEQTTANGFIRDDLIPGMQPTSQLKELFPLVLGLVNDAFRDKFKSWGTFGGAYLNVVRPYCRWAEISNGRITVSLGKEFQNLQSSRYGDVMQGQGWWKRTPGQFKPEEGVVSYHLEDIKQRLFRPSPDYPWVIEFLLGLQGSDVGDRIMDPPKEEDHFRKASFGGRHRVFEGLQLDGRTFPVRIV